MDPEGGDMNTALMLDGNAVAGQLLEIFGRDMTSAIACCANCGARGAIGSLQAFTRGPGVVLRCPTCQSVIARVVVTPSATYLEARGAAYLRL